MNVALINVIMLKVVVKEKCLKASFWQKIQKMELNVRKKFFICFISQSY